MAYKGITFYSESEEEYTRIQKEESAFSRGTPYGIRAVANIAKMEEYLQGRILVVGCGDGLELEAMEKRGFRCAGIDISDVKIDEAVKRGLDAQVARADQKIPFRDDSFMTVYCAHTLEHMQDIDVAISEMRRVADRAVIIVPIEEAGSDNPAHTSPIFTKAYLKKLLGGTIVFEEFVKGTKKSPEDQYFIVVDF